MLPTSSLILFIALFLGITLKTASALNFPKSHLSVIYKTFCFTVIFCYTHLLDGVSTYIRKRLPNSCLLCSSPAIVCFSLVRSYQTFCRFHIFHIKQMFRIPWRLEVLFSLPPSSLSCPYKCICRCPTCHSFFSRNLLLLRLTLYFFTNMNFQHIYGRKKFKKNHAFRHIFPFVCRYTSKETLDHSVLFFEGSDNVTLDLFLHFQWCKNDFSWHRTPLFDQAQT